MSLLLQRAKQKASGPPIIIDTAAAFSAESDFDAHPNKLLQRRSGLVKLQSRTLRNGQYPVWAVRSRKGFVRPRFSAIAVQQPFAMLSL